MDAIKNAIPAMSRMAAPSNEQFQGLLEDLNTPPPAAIAPSAVTEPAGYTPPIEQDPAILGSFMPAAVGRTSVENLIAIFHNTLQAFGIKPHPQWDDVIIRRYQSDPNFDGMTFVLPFAEGIAAARQTSLDNQFQTLLTSFNQALKTIQGVKGNFNQEMGQIVSASEGRIIKELRGIKGKEVALPIDTDLHKKCLTALKFPQRAIDYPGLAEKLTEVITLPTITEIAMGKASLAVQSTAQEGVKTLLKSLVTKGTSSGAGH